MQSKLDTNRFQFVYEQAVLLNEQKEERIVIHSVVSGAIVRDEMQVKAKVETEGYSEELQNQTKTTKNLTTITAATNDQNDNSQTMKDDFTFDSIYSDEFNSETESFTEDKEQDFVTNLDESKKDEKNSKSIQSNRIESVDTMAVQMEECRVHLNKMPRIHSCEYCTKIFTTEDKLTNHRSECFVKNEVGHSESPIEQPNQLQKKKAQSKYLCEKCDKFYASAASLYKHKTTKHSTPGTHVCLTCSTVCRTEDELTKHRTACRLKRRNRLKHSIDANATFECYLCKISSKSISSLFGHMRWKHTMDNVKYKCNICGMAFFSKHLQEVHMKRHTQPVNDRKIMCSICGIYVKKQ
ncbi:myoneurin-like [Sitodiplosis mosellana]|uniref:myoneurin-like n=1 Tax=Sitodiplosis mosellana TaxID=263140 RepID=UPI0024447CA8|nr:myoneurin-like [Sitodiplosis mosellana]